MFAEPRDVNVGILHRYQRAPEIAAVEVEEEKVPTVKPTSSMVRPPEAMLNSVPEKPVMNLRLGSATGFSSSLCAGSAASIGLAQRTQRTQRSRYQT